ncbi:MAG: MBL fold metallo-hydrolase [Chloroflexi bacterium]|nr:MBL fold metallo-hydrolase [Chloroflexota bacterium]
MNSEPSSQPDTRARGQPTRLRWLGHATFLLSSPGEAQVLLDPFNVELGYPVPELPPIDLVAVSHEHADHNNVGLAPGTPKVVRGISDSGWHPGTVSVGDVTLHMIGGAYHDEAEGRERGRTAFMSVEVGGLRLLHLGDLGHRLGTNLLAQCRGHQVLLIPVGGFFTIDGETAAATMDEIAPSIAIPMHYRTSRLPGHPTAPLDETGFLVGREVRRLAESEIALRAEELPARPQVVVPAVP